MADITGYSPAQAQQDINNFTEAYQAADIILQNAMGDFVDELSTKWYSPKAVEFWHFYVAERTILLTLITRTEWTILSNSVASYNILAKSNGAATMDNPYTTWASSTNPMLFTSSRGDPTFKEVSDNGAVGMNTLAVKSMLIPLLVEGVNRSIEAFMDLPTNIAFYDPAGELQAKFKELIKNMVEQIRTQMGNILDKLQTDLEDEVENITLAKEAATDTLSA